MANAIAPWLISTATQSLLLSRPRHWGRAKDFCYQGSNLFNGQSIRVIQVSQTMVVLLSLVWTFYHLRVLRWTQLIYLVLCRRSGTLGPLSVLSSASPQPFPQAHVGFFWCHVAPSHSATHAQVTGLMGGLWKPGIVSTSLFKCSVQQDDARSLTLSTNLKSRRGLSILLHPSPVSYPALVNIWICWHGGELLIAISPSTCGVLHVNPSICHICCHICSDVP